MAGALSLATCICGACKASASTTPTGNPQTNTRVLLAEEESPTSVFRLSTCSIKRARVFPASNSLPDMVVAAVVDTAAAAVDMVVVAVMGAPRTDAATAVEAADAEDAASEDVEDVEGAADAASG